MPLETALAAFAVALAIYAVLLARRVCDRLERLESQYSKNLKEIGDGFTKVNGSFNDVARCFSIQQNQINDLRDSEGEWWKNNN